MSALAASLTGSQLCSGACSHSNAPTIVSPSSYSRLPSVASKRSGASYFPHFHALALGPSKSKEGCLLSGGCSSSGTKPQIQCSLAERGSESRAVASSVEELQEENPVLGENLKDITEWELDFCSRPILDSRGKRVWELLVCDSTGRLKHAEYFPSNRINSVTLLEALEEIRRRTGAPKPQKIRFFRSQLQTIITKACVELDIRPVPSQRCVALIQWLQSRYTEVYMKEPGFMADAPPLLQIEDSSPAELPEALRGEKWAFVQLPLSGIIEEMERVKSTSVFGSVLDLEAMGLADLPLDNTMIPGVSVVSSRAVPLAAWTSSLELANLRVDYQKACLILKTGVSDSWRYAFFRRNRQSEAEARAWEEAKKECFGLHFLAIQNNLESEDCTGFWLMRDMPPMQI